MISNDFDRLAPVYDGLARLVFGKAMVASQTCFLDEIPNGSKLLIIGGGTGWILQEIFRRKPDCEVWYIEQSKKMLESARKKYAKQANKYRIHFIQGTEDAIPNDLRADAVITNFFLDLFTNAGLNELVLTIKSRLHANGRWLVSEFVDEDQIWWQKNMLKTMYWFFRKVCSIKVNKLPDWKRGLVENGFFRERSTLYYARFIESAVYRQSATY